MRKGRGDRNTGGQSTIEFALMIILLMSMVFFVLQLALIFSYGNYVHYATFMSARALLSANDTTANQTAAATSVLDLMLGPKPRNRFNVIGKSVNEDAPANEVVGQDPHYTNKRSNSWLQGVRYTFRSPLFRVPMAGLGGNAASGSTINAMTLTSESWLGMDPSSDACTTFMNQMEQNNKNPVVLDNGC